MILNHSPAAPPAWRHCIGSFCHCVKEPDSREKQKTAQRRVQIARWKASGGMDVCQRERSTVRAHISLEKECKLSGLPR
eukprot:266626-Pleurochrysis_carterae.AAC.2